MRLFFRAFFLSLPVYLLTLAPTVTGEDSGELVTAACTLGIPHPPGYPLWCVLGKLFTVVIPSGDVAYRVNLLSAVLAASAAGVLAHVVRRLLLRAGLPTGGIPLAAALVFSFSRDFWAQSTIAEVYTLNILFLAVLLLLALLWEERCEPGHLYLFAALWGLAVTNHTTIIPLGAVLLAYMVLCSPRKVLRTQVILPSVGLFLVGLSVFFYLPLRSLADPAMDWGNPETLDSALAHVFRKQYAAVESPGVRTTANQLALVGNFLKDFSAQFTPVLFPAILIGAWRQLRRDLRGFLLLATLFLLGSYGIIWLFNYPAVREDLVIKRTFYLPAYAVSLPWLGLGLATLAGAVGAVIARLGARNERALSVRAALSVLAVSLPLLWHYRENDRSDYYYASDLGRNILETLPEGAVIVSSSDHTTFPLIYLTAVEGLRTDIVIADKYGYVEDELLESIRAEKKRRGRAPPLEKTRNEKIDYLVRESERPVFFTVKRDLRHLGFTLLPYGLLYKAVRPAERPPEEELEEVWERYTWHEGTFDRAARDYSADMILADYHFARARHLLLLDRKEEALHHVERSASHAWGIKEVFNNIGGYLSESGFPAEAIPYLEEAWRIHPGYATAAKNLAISHFEGEMYAEGFRWFRLLLRNGDEGLVALLGAARGAKALGRRERAALYYIRLGRRNVLDPEIYAEILEHLRPLDWAEEYVAEFEEKEKELRERRAEPASLAGSLPPGIELLPKNVREGLPEDTFPRVHTGPGALGGGTRPPAGGGQPITGEWR